MLGRSLSFLKSCLHANKFKCNKHFLDCVIQPPRTSLVLSGFLKAAQFPVLSPWSLTQCLPSTQKASMEILYKSH
jgi:hypothetical protein